MMRTYLLAAALLATGAANGADTVADGEAIKARDHALNAAILRDDVDAARTFYDDAFVLTTSSGKLKSKDDLLREIATPGLVLEVNAMADADVRVRRDTAVLTGILHQRGVYDGKAFDVHVRVTDTWIRIGGEWRILAGHASRL